MIKLTITEKGGETKALSFDQEEVVIGRVQGNDIVIPKGNISKRHTKVTMSGGRLTVTDLKSTNGTYVNGRKISEPTAVRGGDKIFVGDFLIVLDPGGATAEPSSGARRLPGGPPPPPPPPRSGRRSGAHAVADAGAAPEFGSPGERSPTTASGGRPAPPPPPPPRPTIMRPGLEDDSADIGLDGPPPSLADVAGVDPDDSLGDLASPASGRGATTQGDSHLEDVFGSEAAEDEDAHAEFSRSAPTSGSGREHLAAPAFDLPAQPDAGEDTAHRVEGDATATPPPASVPSGPTSSPPMERVEKEPSGPAPASLESLLADPTVTAIVITPGVPIEVERGGKLESVGELGDRNTVAEAVWLIANTANPPPAGDNPIVDVRLPDGTHVTALFPPITAAPVCAAIRKATVPESPLLEVAGSPDVEKLLTAALASRRNLLLAGDAQSVATLAGALAGAFPADRRVVSIGAGAKSRPGWTELAPTGDLPSLIRAAGAFRAQHLLIADLGGAELPDVLLAVARGQDGVIAAVAARSAAEALTRLRAFSIGAVGTAAFPLLVTSTIDLVVFVTSTPAGVRVVEIAEPTIEGDAVTPTFVAKRPEANRTSLTLDVPGVSTRLAAAIAVAGDGLPSHLIRQ
jgi:pilus assembly protein CpaF